MRTDRLLKLAEFLQSEVPRDYFDLRTIVGNPSAPQTILPSWDATSPNLPSECGTTACAIGWLPGAFPGEWFWIKRRVGSGFGYTVSSSQAEPDSDEYHDWESEAYGFFGLREGDFNYLFMPSYYKRDELKNPLVVAGRIIKLVREYEKKLTPTQE